MTGWLAPGRVVALLMLALAVALDLWNPAPLRAMRARGFDVVQRLWPLPPGRTLVQVVAVDEESLRRLGQWPWPRALLARLVQRIAAGRPAALGVDILFPEPDRFSPPLLARTLPNLPAPLADGLAGLPSSDSRLAAAFASVPTVLGEAASDQPRGPSAAPRRVTLVRQLGDDPRPYLLRYRSAVESVPEIGRAARAEAALAGQPDADGVVRAVPLLISVAGRQVPTLALQLIRVAAGLPSLWVKTDWWGIEDVGLGPLTIPTDGQARAYLHFGLPRARYVSAAAVLDPDFDPRQFAGQIVLLGVTGLGLVDQKFTPLGLTQGIDLHAQLIESILGHTLLHRPAYARWIEFAALLTAGLAVAALVRYDSPRLAAGAVIGITAGLIGGEFALFRFAGWLIDGFYPAAAALATAGGMLLGHLRAAQVAQRRLAAELARERELKARTEGELAAARDLQLGLLPHRFPAFPDRPDIDLYARIEPARAVGGDFFDFRLIDAEHLFFMIADVSGKGVPAALFMEMTMQIVRAAVQRHQSALDRVLAEANAQTAAASTEMGEAGDGMFVTAFAGILDTASGELAYASAGHDAPFLVRGGAGSGGSRKLETEGGPPLGVLEDFAFPIDRDRLEPGAVLLLYTDGLTEAQNDAGDFYSAARLAAALQKAPCDRARAVVEACFEAVNQFVADAEQADDITVLAIRRAAEG